MGLIVKMGRKADCVKKLWQRVHRDLTVYMSHHGKLKDTPSPTRSVKDIHSVSE